MMDSIPVVAITGQVSTKLIGSDAFQEADTFGITRSCTKHNFLVKNVADLPQTIHEAFYICASGRPGPVLVDIPKDVFQAQYHYAPVSTIHLPGYKVYTEGHTGQIRRAAQMMWEAERPFVYAGGGIVAADASAELRELVETLDVPAVNTLMGLGALPSHHPNFISMPGMHGSYAANMGMTHADLLIALGVRFDDRVTGRLSAFAPHAKVIHVDIDPAEIGKNRAADLPIVGDVKRVLAKLNKILQEAEPAERSKNAAARQAWWTQIRAWKEEHPLTSRILHHRNQAAAPDGAKSTASPAARRSSPPTSASIRCGPRSSSASTSRGCGSIPAASAPWASDCPPPSAPNSRAPTSWSSPSCGDGGFQMSIPELATIANHALPIKIIVMNNGYLGMVRQWQELFYNNRLSSGPTRYLPGRREAGRRLRIQGPHHRDARTSCAPRSKRPCSEPGPYLLERSRVAV